MNFPGGAVELLQGLIRIPSVNPSGGTTAAETGEKACAEYIGEFLRGCGAEVTLPEVEPGRPNVVGKFPFARDAARRIIFAPHTDTVSVEGMTIDPFGAEVRQGRIYGRGASDTKGSIAAMLWALHEMREEIPRLPWRIEFAGLMSEEAGQLGSKALAEELVREGPHVGENTFVVVGEPTRLDVVHTHKGSLWITLRARGKAVHSSQPEKGENAIAKMLPALEYFGREFAARHLVGEDSLLGKSTVSVGTVRGGTQPNIVPDLCEATVDVRLLPAVETAELQRSVVDDLAAQAPGVEASFASWAALATDTAHPVVQTLRAQGARCTGAPWFCDAAIFAAHGIPAVAIGPGSIEQAHTKDEFLATDDLLAGVEFFKRFLRALR
jgi:acetylornithine deacetylase/succinyl-diaminopimelate desuccinylase-like protein